MSQNELAIEKINPLNYMGVQDYSSVWEKLFSTLLYGFWGRFFFVVFMFLAFYVGVRQRNPLLAAIFLFLAAVIAYGGGAMHVFNLVTGT